MVSGWCWWLAALTASAGLGQQSPGVISLATLFAALGLITADVANVNRGGVTAITVFSVSSLGTAFANLVALYSTDASKRALYFHFVAENHLLFAAELQLAQTILPVLGFWMMARHASARSLLEFLPPIESRIGLRTLIVGGAAVSTVIIVLNLAAHLTFTSAPVFLLTFIPNLAAFTLARVGTAERNLVALRLGLAIALGESVRALLFGYLRGTVAHPLLAFAAGATLGERSLRPLRRRIFLPVVIAGSVFVWFYGLLGETRGQYRSGWSKVMSMAQYQSRRFDSPDAPPQQTVLARLTSVNQLSQVGYLVEKNGFYGGRTFEYLRVAFVPRFLWPEKPRIALGAWYAMEIGQAVATEDGWFNNSVNMTEAGELYLNFGWRAVFPGLLIYGAILGFLWTRTNFWEMGARNVLGGVLAVVMMWTLILGAGESPTLVSLIAVYLCLLTIAVVWSVAAHLRARLWERQAAGGHPLTGWRAQWPDTIPNYVSRMRGALRRSGKRATSVPA